MANRNAFRSRSRSTSFRDFTRAFTLVELLVVIAIIGVLMGLLLPAVQAARSSARRAVCSNNLRQCALGIEQYQAAHAGQIPPGGVEYQYLIPGGKNFAWSMLILPFIEQGAVYQKINQNVPFNDTANAEAAKVVIPVYLCPELAKAEAVVAGMGQTHYGGVCGTSLPEGAKTGDVNGAMIFTGTRTTSGRLGKTTVTTDPLTFADVTDGMANTLFLAEDARSNDQYAYGDRAWISANNVFEVAHGVNDAPDDDNEIFSLHTGGAHTTFGDASVRFLGQGISPSILGAMITRDYGDVYQYSF